MFGWIQNINKVARIIEWPVSCYQFILMVNPVTNMGRIDMFRKEFRATYNAFYDSCSVLDFNLIKSANVSITTSVN